MTILDEHVAALLVQKHQLVQSEAKISELDAVLTSLQQSQTHNENALDAVLADLDIMLESQSVDVGGVAAVDVSHELAELAQSTEIFQSQSKIAQISMLDLLEFRRDMSWTEYQRSVEQYASRNNVDLSTDPFKRFACKKVIIANTA